MSIFSLKIIAVIAMFIDHIGMYLFPDMIFLRIIGRISYPIFIFCFAVGFSKTRNKVKYLSRLYLANVIVSAMITLMLFCLPDWLIVDHSIFRNFFLTGVIIFVLENVFSNTKKSIFSGIILFLSFFNGFLLYSLLKDWRIGNLIFGIFPNFIVLEYDFSYIVLGVLIYFFLQNKTLMLIIFAAFCFSKINEMSGVQFFMISSLIFIALYNGKRGRKWSWFFYIFYPVHILILIFYSNIFR